MHRACQYIVHTAIAASLTVLDGIADSVFSRLAAEQEVISTIDDHTVAHAPPSRAAIQDAVHSNVAAIALVLTRMLLAAEHRQLRRAAAAIALAPAKTEAAADQQAQYDAETQAIRHRMQDAMQSFELHTVNAELQLAVVDAYGASSAAAP